LVASSATIAAPGGAISFVIDESRRERERDLVRAAKAGDVSAFERLYQENVKRVYALCYRMAGSAQQAEELTQDVFVRAWQKLSGFRGDSAFASWLHPIAVNVTYSERRSRQRRESRVTAYDDLTPFEGGAPPALGLDLERAIQGLPEGARDELRDLIDDYVDGELPAGERDSVARHLLDCPACREQERALRTLLDEAAALPRELDPARELWPGIAVRLRPSVVAFPRRPFQPLTLLAAAAVLIALSSSITWRIARTPRAPVAATTSSAPAFSLAAFRPAPDLLEAEREYASATTELLAAIEARRESFAPETLVTVEQSLRAIDDALKSLREALRGDPGNDELTQMLTATHKRKVDALRRVVRLSKI